jgi:hypothetical protein
MAAELRAIADLLGKWRHSGQYLSVSFTGAASAAWQRTGKVIDVGQTEFEVSWTEGDSQSFKYDGVVGIAEGGKLLFLTSESGDRLTVYERPSSHATQQVGLLPLSRT